jgi:competence protein ComEC
VGSSKSGEQGKPNPALWPRAAAAIEPLLFRRSTLLASAAWFGLGIVLARNWQPPVILLTAATVLIFLSITSLKYSLRLTLLPLAAIWIVLGFWCAEMERPPQSQRALLQNADGLSRTVRGRIVRIRPLPPRDKTADQDNDPAWWIEKEPEAVEALSVDLQVEKVEEVTPDISRMLPTTGGVRATIMARGDTLPTLHCGDIVEAPMRLRIPERYRDPGAWQYADYLLAQGLGTHATVRAAKIHVVGADESSVQCRLYAAQSWASERMLKFVRSSADRRLPQMLRLTPDDAGMLNAMLFGDREALDHDLRLGFERTGSFHLFVVSGMHVALLAGIVFWITHRLHLREWLATLVTLTATTGYALLTGFGPPVQRALFMTAIFLVARLISRDQNVLHALGAAALGALILSPKSLFEASFQMTFLAIVAIGGIAVPLAERSFAPYARAASNLNDRWRDMAFPPRAAQFRMMLQLWGNAIAKPFGAWTRPLPAVAVRCGLWIVELALIGLVAELVMVLPMALYFHRATIFALPANMAVVPIVTMLAPLAVVTFCASLLSPWIATIPSSVTAALLHSVANVIARISHIHSADLRIPGPIWQITLLAVIGWALCCWAVRRSLRWTWTGVAVLPLIAAIVLWPAGTATTAHMMEVTAIDVGQGDSLLLVSPEGQTLLVDAGGPVGISTETADASGLFDIGEEVVSPYLWSRRIRRLDVMVLSHAHSDHMGGMAAVMRGFRPRELWVGIDPDSAAYRALLAEARDLGVTVRHLHAGDALTWSGTAVSILAPEASYVNGGAPGNNDSLVMRVEYGRSSVLFEGDAEAPSEMAMVASGRLAPVTLLKVGHHGSRTSTTPEFFAAVAPKDAVVSVGRGNTFGHPRFEVIQRMALNKTRLYRTDEFGLTTFLLGRDGGIQAVTGGS